MEFSFGFILSLAIAIFLAIDAPKHGKNPWLWGILGFVFGTLALGIYFINTGRKVAGWIIVIITIILILLLILFFAAFFFLIFQGV
ncbi:hypothetical protein [Metabacillus litoralis]|uniref:hypothetical protein n=1 Tax=Metabacillus litoralis TaxID=152268 RepID=UPI001CFDAEFE|nr:hypothetical protein [Metabacillus litoralis]